MGYFLYTSQGAKKKNGGAWQEKDFMPQKPVSEETKAAILKAQFEAMIAIQNKAKNGD